ECERLALAEPAAVAGDGGLPERAQLGLAAAVEVARRRRQVAGVALERLVEQCRLHQARRRAAPVDRVRVVGGIADREEAGRERKPASIDEAPETVAKLSHDEDGRLLACDRDRGAARAPRRDGRKGAQEALEARWWVKLAIFPGDGRTFSSAVGGAAGAGVRAPGDARGGARGLPAPAATAAAAA